MAYGKLELFVGPMFSGKSTKLLRNLLAARDFYTRRVLLLKPAMDDRYSAGSVVTHDGRSNGTFDADASAVSGWPQVPVDVEQVFIDEAQFFEPPYVDGDTLAGIRQLLERGTDVVACGLDMDWQGRPFPVTSALLGMADRVEKLTAQCTVCGRPAGKTMKISGDGPTVELGASGAYEARCNAHWPSFSDPLRRRAAAPMEAE